MIHELKTKEEIKKFLELKDTILILNFHSETCGPCVMQMPILEDIANDFKITLITLDIDEDRSALEKFNISATPTTQIYKNGQLVFTNVGFLPYERWSEELSKYQ